MIHKRRILGLAVAIFVAKALIATGAFAFEFTAYDTNTKKHVSGTIEGTQPSEYQHKLTLGPVGAVLCSTATFAGNLTDGTENELVVTPQYTGCKTLIGGSTFKTEVHVQECAYYFHISGESGADLHSGTADFVCNKAPNSMTITLYNAAETTVKCTIHIEEKYGINNVTYKTDTAAAPTNVTIATESNNMAYRATGGLLNCGTTEATRQDGAYASSTKIEAKNTFGSTVDLTVM